MSTFAWSWRIGAQGNSECLQVLAHKNLDGFKRKVFLPGARRVAPRDRPAPRGA